MSISSLKLGGWAENNPVRSSVSDQCYFYAKYDENASTSVTVGRLGLWEHKRLGLSYNIY